MKAKELIKQLQSLVNDYGDRDVEVNGMYANEIPIHSKSFLEIADIDIFADSSNFQILVNNA